MSLPAAARLEKIAAAPETVHDAATKARMAIAAPVAPPKVTTWAALQFWLTSSQKVSCQTKTVQDQAVPPAPTPAKFTSPWTIPRPPATIEPPTAAGSDYFTTPAPPFQQHLCFRNTNSTSSSHRASSANAPLAASVPLTAFSPCASPRHSTHSRNCARSFE